MTFIGIFQVSNRSLYVIYAIFALPIFIICIIVLLVFCRAPQGVKGCTMATPVYTVPIFLLTLLLLLIAVGIGDGIYSKTHISLLLVR